MKNAWKTGILISALLGTMSFYSCNSMSGADSTSGITITSLVPGGERGLFWDDESIHVTINGANTTGSTQDFLVTFVMTDFNGSQIGNPVDESILAIASNERFSRNVNLGVINDKHGWFCIRATVSHEGIQLAQKATGCCVFERVAMDSPFFSANCNGAFDDLLIPAMQRIGILSKGVLFKLGYAQQDWRTNGYLSDMLTANPFWNSSLEIVGYILTDRYAFGWPTWHITGEYPYSEAYYAEFGDFIEAIAKTCGRRIEKWVVSEEYEPSFAGVRRQDEVDRYIRQSRIIYDRLKAVNPDCIVVGLTPSSTELFPPDFWQIAKTDLLPNGLSGHFDIIGPDAYCAGDYEITTSNIDSCIPETSPLREALLATRDLQASLHNGRTDICISEYGYMIPFHYDEPDNYVTKRVANLLARYILIVKTVPDVSALSLYAVSAGAAWDAYQIGSVSTDAHPIWDYGLWRIDYPTDGSSAPYCYPRPWVAALATLNRFLGNASNPVEVPLSVAGCHGWRFEQGSKTVIALWTSSPVPCPVILNLPSCAEFDLMGNPQILDPGDNKLTLSESPIFIVY